MYRSQKPFDPKRFWKFIQFEFPKTVIRSKGLFWLASRPQQALVWSQAGGSLRADSAGVWWSSMPYKQRIQYASFTQNQEQIESEWSKTFGDRKNEIVFIGQEMDEAEIRAGLNKCLLTDNEIAINKWKKGYDDEWPVQRAFPLE
jgi:G3E family GTPase